MPTYFQREKLNPSIGKSIDALIDHELAFSLFKQVADTPGPSQSVTYTRGRTIEQILNKHLPRSRQFSFQSDYQGTGNIAVLLGDTPHALFFAHADEISYLLGAEPEGTEIKLTPFCSHGSKDGHPVISLRYALQEQNLKRAASGSIISRIETDQLVPYLLLKEGKVEVGDRIIFDYPAVIDEHNLVYGKVDNAAGVTACLLAIIALGVLESKTSIWFVFPDEEEGPPMGNSMFARGARRLVQRLDLPSDMLCVVVDGHDVEPGKRPSRSALFRENESLCKGAVVPPPLYAEFKEFANHLRHLEIDILENSRRVARSDSPALMEYFRNILLLGYHVKDAHFDDGSPCTSLDAIISVAKTIVAMALALDLTK
jgi:hypothetical protein